MRFVVCAILTIGVSCPALAAAEPLEALELAQLDRYLATLKVGGLGSAAQVELLADMSFAGLERAMRQYADLSEPIEPHSHRAWQTLLERTSRSALLPWPMIELYSPDFGRFLTQTPQDDLLVGRLFARLISSGGDRRSFDLAVRLVPVATLDHLARGQQEHRVALLEAWNRRLGRGSERRPIHDLDQSVATIVKSFLVDLAPTERTALLGFAAAWPKQRERYEQSLTDCLRNQRADVVVSGLTVQQHTPACLELNEAVVGRFAGDDGMIEAALRNYAFDTAHDHSAVLRRLWATLPRERTKARYNCLFSMGSHPHGNDDIALAALLEQPYELLDVAAPVLAAGDPKKARRAIGHVLTHEKRGHEEALRLADHLQLAGFEEQALAIALDAEGDQILRHSAILYLRWAEGATRRRLLGFLAHRNADLRLATIQMFAPPEKLTAADKDEIGPALVRVAIDDASPGHRQEAIHALGAWRDPHSAELFRKILAQYPPVQITDGRIEPERYWPYRLRLVALLGLARLDDRAARDELLDLHRHGGPTERMDVLLAMRELGRAPEAALADLRATEPKLVATAAELIDEHGDMLVRDRMRSYFRRTPLWLEFRDSGIDDHRILDITGLQTR